MNHSYFHNKSGFYIKSTTRIIYIDINTSVLSVSGHSPGEHSLLFLFNLCMLYQKLDHTQTYIHTHWSNKNISICINWHAKSHEVETYKDDGIGYQTDRRIHSWNFTVSCVYQKYPMEGITNHLGQFNDQPRNPDDRQVTLLQISWGTRQFSVLSTFKKAFYIKGFHLGSWYC